MSIEDTIRAIIREELEPLRDNFAQDRLAYSVPELAIAMGISDRQLYKHIDRGDLTAKYSGAKKIIPVSEAQRFIRELPEEDLGSLL
ncbi:hypothetical protein [Microbacterium sp. NPDC089696]|uniref:hypothetical protein n=1 Tax=Microbacterium sp. NPDC089696 TaxID=3364199 RepID=UPI0038018913